VTVGEPADFGTLLLELYAYMGDGMNYYIDRVAAEPFLATAVRRQSILGIADMLGYNPIAQQAATLMLEFSLADDAYINEAITIDSGVLVQTTAQREENAIFFETLGVLTLGGPSGPRTGTMGGIEGRTVEREYVGVSNGAPLQDFILANAGVIERSLALWVAEANGAEYQWDFVDRLTDAGPEASVYTTSVDENFFMHLRTGDAVSGRIPPVNATIYASYRYGRGSQGNVVVGQVVLLTDPIQGVSVVNTTQGHGGADPESIDSMRYSIPRAARASDRAVTLEDFATLAQQVPGVAKATSYGQYYTAIHVPIAPVGGGDPPEDLKDRVAAYLQERMMVGTTVLVEDPQWLDAECTLVVHVLPNFGQGAVRQDVEDTVAALFAFEVVGFGTRISIGDVFRAAIDVAGVDYIELTVLRAVGAPAPAVQDIVPTATQLPRMAEDDLTVTAVGGLV
jgi:hypothetical protein